MGCKAREKVHEPSGCNHMSQISSFCVLNVMQCPSNRNIDAKFFVGSLSALTTIGLTQVPDLKARIFAQVTLSCCWVVRRLSCCVGNAL
mmetsp:Transcript_27724/g.44633  ORF Transcript_27724/g.44633 Transcript_27724/m.44633 type:complete len:89 (-) Transcript_27724:669-935(-)